MRFMYDPPFSLRLRPHLSTTFVTIILYYILKAWKSPDASLAGLLGMDKPSNCWINDPTATSLIACGDEENTKYMPAFKTEESRQAYHIYRQQLTERQRREREERKGAKVFLCRACGTRIGFIEIPFYDKELDEIASKSLPTVYGTTELHSCPEYRRLKAQLVTP
jgi:hypothetical protein